MNPSLLEALRGRLIVSIQPPVGTPMRTPQIVAAMAQVAVAAGAAAVRIESAADIAAVRAAIQEPIIGLIKRVHPGFLPYITPTLADVEAVLEAGADIVAVDATRRSRPEPLLELIRAIHRNNALAMADCAEFKDAQSAISLGSDLLGTTLCGYTAATKEVHLPALSLCREIATLGAFTVCEGGIASTEDARRALTAGADALVVGTALTNLSSRVGEFVASIANKNRS